jgi:5-methylthioadenosine/S-adenosylhomocysteine deaminase
MNKTPYPPLVLEEKQVDLLIRNGTVMTMDTAGTSIAAGALAVAGDRIVAVGTAAELKAWRAAQTLDAHGGLILPGLINTHTHVAMALFRGLADDLPLMSWLNDHIFPAEAKLTPEMVAVGTHLACAELIRSGTTCFCDMYLFEAAVAEAAKQCGLRAVVGEVFFDFPSPNYGPIEKGFEYARELLARWQNDPLIRIAIEPHSPYLCAPELITRASRLAEDNGALLVIHLSETRAEVAQILEKYKRTPTGHLAQLGVLSPRLVACHAVVLTEEDIALLAAHDVKVSHNPESNMKLASGVAPVPDLLAAGVCVGLGTDGCASNNNLDLFCEMDTAAKLHKVQRLDPTVMEAAIVLAMTTRNAARVLGLEQEIGSLEVGKRADLIVVDTNQPHLTPMYDPVSHLVYAARGSDVVHSVINGRVVMEDRRLLTLDEARVLADARQAAALIRP